MRLAAAIFLATAAWAQMNTAELSGTVKDRLGGALSGASVVAVNAATHLAFSTVSNSAGDYLLAQLPSGQYSITASAAGFKQASAASLTFSAGERTRQDFTLDVGDQNEVVLVEARGLAQTDSAEIKDVVGTQQILDLPLKDREFLQLSLMSAGVVNPPGGTRGDSLQQTGALVNILGQRTGHNLFLVDGVSVTDEYFNNVALSPPPEAIQEFNIDKTNYPAEFGGKSGGVVNVVTQSGTNALHGTLYEFLRNSKVDAKNFFAFANQPTPPFQENQFGAAVGGPVAKNKTFFFADYDGVRIGKSLSDLFSVPTAAQREGVFTTPIRDPATGAPFPGNAIDVPLNPAASALLAKVPLPNLPGTANNLLAIDKQTNDNNQFDGRLDHHFSPRDSAYARVSVFRANEFDPFGSSALNEALLPGFGRTLDTHSVNVSASETHVFSPSVLNEVRFGWLSVSGGQDDPNAGNPFAAQYGLGGIAANPADMGYPQVSLSNAFSTMGAAAGFTTRVDRDVELFDDATLQRGAHTIQFGGYFFHLGFNPSFPNDARGIYTFSGAYTGNPLADFLLGYPSQAQVGIGSGAENAHTSWAHFYVQDGWRVTRNLKLDAGLRYEYNQNLTARANQTSDIDLLAPGGPEFVVAGDPSHLPPAASALAALSPIPIASASAAGWNNSLLTPKNVRLSPRLGLAWSIPGTHQTVIRSGFGIYTNQAAYSVMQDFAENLPFFLIKTVANSPSSPSAGSPAYSMQSILSANPTGAAGANGVNHNFAIEYNEVWNLAVERQIASATSIEADYEGSRTVHADSATALNIPMTFGGARPYPQLNAFTTIRWDGWATFNALTIKATRRATKGVSLDATYTWSKSLDDASDAGTTNAEYNLPQNVYAPALEKGLSSFDHRQRATASVLYPLPFGARRGSWARKLAGGWNASGIFLVQGGAPFTVNLSSAAGQDVAHLGLVNGLNLERPDLVGDPNAAPKTPAQWFNTAAFALPAQNTFGTAGRNVVEGPALANLDFSLQKETDLHEGSLKLQIRCDVYDVFNHPNFNLPGRIFGASNFGVISSAQDPREFQFAVKLKF